MSMKERFLATGYNLLEWGRDDRPRRLVATDLAGFAWATFIIPLCKLSSIFRFRTSRFDLPKWPVVPRSHGALSPGRPAFLHLSGLLLQSRAHGPGPNLAGFGCNGTTMLQSVRRLAICSQMGFAATAGRSLSWGRRAKRWAPS
jgi:hypothetical protein